MIDRNLTLRREAASTAESAAMPAAGGALAVLLAVILMLSIWFLVASGLSRPSVTVNDHTDNAVPTVDQWLPARSVTG